MQKGKKHIHGMVVALHPSATQASYLLRVVGAQEVALEQVSCLQ